MSATVRIDLYSEPACNPMDIWHKRESAYTYLYPDDLDGFIGVVESICRGGELTEAVSLPRRIWSRFGSLASVVTCVLFLYHFIRVLL